MNVNPINPSSIQGINPLKPESTTKSPANQITQTFDQALKSLDQSQATSDGLLEKLAAGEDVDLHQVMIATQETDINFRVAIAIRDRLVDAYREVTRMSI